MNDKISQAITVVLGVVGFVGTVIGLINYYVRKIERLELSNTELRTDLAELQGIVKAQQEGIHRIDKNMERLETKLDMLLERK